MYAVSLLLGHSGDAVTSCWMEINSCSLDTGGSEHGHSEEKCKTPVHNLSSCC